MQKFKNERWSGTFWDVQLFTIFYFSPFTVQPNFSQGFTKEFFSKTLKNDDSMDPCNQNNP